jgi:hypothetical protein
VRTVPLIAPLLSDLDYLRILSGMPEDHHLIFPARDGRYWSRSEFNNWRNRIWKPILRDLADCDPPLPALAKARPYDCRGTFVSLNLRGGASPLEVAKWAGHSPAVMFRHYANVIDELQGEPILSAEEQILRAREAVDKMAQEELDELVADLIERPTISGAQEEDQERGLPGRPREIGAARLLYGPNK